MTRAFLLLALSASASWTCVRTGSFAQPVTPNTGNQVITFGTGVACAPKVVLFWHNTRTADGGEADAIVGFGAVVSSSARVAGYTTSADALGSSNSAKVMSQARAVIIMAPSKTTQADADLVTLNSDGFTLNWNSVDSIARIINYLAIGGTDVTNAAIGSYTAAGASQGITGVGFQPDLVIFFFSGAVSGTAADSANYGIGFATPTASWALASGTPDNQATTDANRYQRTGKSFVVISGVGTAVTTECTLSSMDTDGFTQACSTQGGHMTNYIALKGGTYNLGSFNQPTSAGNSVISGLSHTPEGVLLASFGNVTSSTVVASARASWGAATTTSSRWSVWHGDTDNVADTISSQALDRTKVVVMKTEAGAAPTTQASADLVSLDATGFTINWGVADATAREVLYFTASSGAAGGVTAIPRRVFVQ